MSARVVLIYLCVVLPKSLPQDISSIADLKTLSELPLEKLIKLRNNFEPPLEIETPERPITAKLEVRGDNPEALALQAKRKPYSRGGYEPEYHKEKDHKDVNSIFQMSVTTLAFVAFGGYLLCLIVQAIKAKNNTAMDTTGNMMAMLVRPPGRPNRIRNPPRQTKPARRPRPGNNINRYKREMAEVWPDANPQGMYDALIMLAEGYSKYRTVDYRHYNHTIKGFA